MAVLDVNIWNHIGVAVWIGESFFNFLVLGQHQVFFGCIRGLNLAVTIVLNF